MPLQFFTYVHPIPSTERFQLTLSEPRLDGHQDIDSHLLPPHFEKHTGNSPICFIRYTCCRQRRWRGPHIFERVSMQPR